MSKFDAIDGGLLQQQAAAMHFHLAREKNWHQVAPTIYLFI